MLRIGAFSGIKDNCLVEKTSNLIERLNKTIK